MCGLIEWSCQAKVCATALRHNIRIRIGKNVPLHLQRVLVVQRQRIDASSFRACAIPLLPQGRIAVSLGLTHDALQLTVDIVVDGADGFLCLDLGCDASHFIGQNLLGFLADLLGLAEAEFALPQAKVWHQNIVELGPCQLGGIHLNRDHKVRIERLRLGVLRPQAKFLRDLCALALEGSVELRDADVGVLDRPTLLEVLDETLRRLGQFLVQFGVVRTLAQGREEVLRLLRLIDLTNVQ